jgi:hypothetical protein
MKRFAFVIALLLGTAACQSSRPSTGPTPPQSGPTEVPTSLPPRTPLEDAIKTRYQEQFSEPIYRPAIYNDPRSVDCAGNGHLTTTAYLPSSGGGTTLLTLYTSRDGTQVTHTTTTTPAFKPAGHFRVLVGLLTWPQTLTDAGLPLWEAAQASINEDHAAFAASRHYGAPIVSFESTNVLIPGTDVPNLDQGRGVVQWLRDHGQPVDSYDFVMAVNIDPSKAEGGLSLVGTVPGIIYMGNFFRAAAPLTAADWISVAHASYHHEVAHHWGWPANHDWSPACGSTDLGFGNLIAAPILFGWEDTDGDGVPEILDSTPYGRSF